MSWVCLESRIEHGRPPLTRVARPAQALSVSHAAYCDGSDAMSLFLQFWVKPEKKKETEEEQQARLEKFAAELEAAEAPSVEAPPAAAAMTE